MYLRDQPQMYRIHFLYVSGNHSYLYIYEAVGASLNELIGESKIPDYLDAFIAWKEAFMNGTAGVFSTSIGESVQFIDDSVNR
jgi:hypothetical protein